MLQALSNHYNFSMDVPFKDLPKEIQDIILFGTDERIAFAFQRETNHIM